MRLTDIVKFLTLLGIGEMKISEEEDWVRCSCPLAAWTHFKGEDSNPSFGVKVNDSGESGFHCFTCHSGRLLDLVHILHFTIGMPVRASDFLSLAEVFDEEQEERDLSSSEFYIDTAAIEIIPPKKTPVPKEVLEQYPLLENTEHEVEQIQIENYFMDRGIRPDVCYDYGVRMQPISSYILFPIFDTDGEAYQLHIKVLHHKQFFYVTPELAGYPEMKQWGRKDYWFGIQFYDPIKPVVLVESETDVLRLRSMDIDNVIATCGPLNKAKADRITNSTIYLGFDSDQAGSKFTMKAIQFFKGRELYKLDWSLVNIKWYTKKKRLERERPAKDAGDIQTVEQYYEVLRNKMLVGKENPELDSIGYKEVW
jgi:5S rRNA maturation endonuclease (ribonuclease M5)